MNSGFTPIEWEAAMETGIDAIDKQHRFLVETLQDANHKLIDSDDGGLLGELAKQLLGYAITHFQTEEALMQRYGYGQLRGAEAENHIAEHRAFSRKIVALGDQLHEGKKISHLEVLQFLNDWLRDHVLGIDQQLGHFLREEMQGRR